MKNKFRIVIYAILFVLTLAAGTYGCIVNYKNNQTTENENNLLLTISNNFNNNDKILYLKTNNNIIQSSVSNKTITIKSTTRLYTNKYYATYKNGYLYYDFDKDDSLQKIVFRVLLASVSQMYGKTYEDVITVLDNSNLNNFIVENGLSYSINDDRINTIINTKIPLNYYDNKVDEKESSLQENNNTDVNETTSIINE